MSVRLTSSDRRVALFDSVTGVAFGPTFADEDEAEAFLRWAAGRIAELRRASDADLVRLVATWRRERAE